MNEVGVDPGIDHMLAMQVIDFLVTTNKFLYNKNMFLNKVFDEVREAGGTITSYNSYCGGLPAPENANNSLRYKFNWSPRAVLFNAISTARYLKSGKVIEIPGNGALLEQGSGPVSFLPGFNLEAFPNRDSIAYIDQYNINSVNSILRGTLRYKGFCHNTLGLVKLGLISTKEHPSLHQGGPDITWVNILILS